MTITLSCSKDNPVEPDPTPQIKTLTVTPTTGIAGSIVTITGLTGADIDPDSLTVTIGGEEVGALSDSTGAIIASLPLFYDTATAWPNPPTRALNVIVSNDVTTIGQALGAVTVSALPQAPGATQRIVDTLTALSTVYKEIFALIPDLGPEWRAISAASLAMFDSTLSISDNSLQSLLDGTASELDSIPGADINLSDAMLAVADVDDQVNAQLAALRALKDAMTTALAAPTARALGANSLTDVRLAYLMQLYVLVKQFGQDVIAATASGWGSSVGITLSTIGLVNIKIPKMPKLGNVPLAKVVSITLSLLNFTVNKLVVSVLPAKISDLSLQFASTSLNKGDTTASVIKITAKTIPAQVSITDMIGYLITAAGFKKKMAETFTDFLHKTAQWYASLTNKVFKDILTSEGLNFTIDQLPEITYGPVDCVDTRIMECYSTNTAVLTAASDTLEWAPPADQQNGSTSLQARTTTSTEVLLDIPGLEYNGGSWGEESKHSASVTVTVNQQLVILTELPNPVGAKSIAELKVRVGSPGANNDTTWVENATVSVIANYGTPETSSGSTDASGWFTTDIYVDDEPGETLVIDITANDNNGSTVTAQASTSISTAFAVEVGFPNVPEFPPYMLVDSETMTVRAGVRIDDQNVNWEQGWDIVVQIWGGQASPQYGVTNSDKFFVTSAGYDPTSDSMRIVVTASKNGNSVVDTAWAKKVNGNGSGRAYPRENTIYTQAHAQATASVVAKCDADTAVIVDNYGGRSQKYTGGSVQDSESQNAMATLWGKATSTVSASTSVSGNVALDSSGSIIRIDGVVAATGSYTWVNPSPAGGGQGCDPGDTLYQVTGGPNFTSGMGVSIFDVVDGPVKLTVTGTVNKTKALSGGFNIINVDGAQVNFSNDQLASISINWVKILEPGTYNFGATFQTGIIHTAYPSSFNYSGTLSFDIVIEPL